MPEVNNGFSRRRYRYYEVLEIRKEATQEEIKAAYRKLVFKYHPDRNADTQANKKIVKINQAYQILSNPSLRTLYDNSPEECPNCWTYEVIQIVRETWRCRRCYCQFDSSGVTEVIEKIEQSNISARQRKYIKMFQTTQCSWCRKFYTQPFLCPFGQLQSSCIPFERLSEKERQTFLREERWWWRMQDMITLVEKRRGIITKCRSRDCLALNPNPQKRACWKCGSATLECPNPKCQSGVFLRYDIEADYWKCISAGCSKKYAILPKKKAAHVNREAVREETQRQYQAPQKEPLRKSKEYGTQASRNTYSEYDRRPRMSTPWTNDYVPPKGRRRPKTQRVSVRSSIFDRETIIWIVIVLIISIIVIYIRFH